MTVCYIITPSCKTNSKMKDFDAEFKKWWEAIKE